MYFAKLREDNERMRTHKKLTPAGELIETARRRIGLSQNAAAARVGISGTRWRQIVKGEGTTEGGRVAVRGGEATIARMALLVGVTAQEMEGAGRLDVARKIVDTDPLAASTVEYWENELTAPEGPLRGEETLYWRHVEDGLEYRLSDGRVSVDYTFFAHETPEDVIEPLRDLLAPHRAGVERLDQRRQARE